MLRRFWESERGDEYVQGELLSRCMRIRMQRRRKERTRRAAKVVILLFPTHQHYLTCLIRIDSEQSRRMVDLALRVLFRSHILGISKQAIAVYVLMLVIEMFAGKELGLVGMLIFAVACLVDCCNVLLSLKHRVSPWHMFH